MTVAVATVSVIAFLVAFVMAGIVSLSTRAVALTREALGVMSDRAIGDDAKEVAMRQAGVQLAVLFASITFRSALALGALGLSIAIGATLGLSTVDATLELMESWEFILSASTVMGLLAAVVGMDGWKS